MHSLPMDEIDTIHFYIPKLQCYNPGILGNIVYELIAGSKKGYQLWDRLVRTVSFSFFGFAVYFFVLVPYFNFPIPQYLVFGTYRVKKPEKVIGELIFLKKKYGMKGFYFRDPTFSIGKERIEKISKEQQPEDKQSPRR